MIISKAIEILSIVAKPWKHRRTTDFQDAHQLGIEALKRIEDVRLHPFHPIYSPLPGESIPERGKR